MYRAYVMRSGRKTNVPHDSFGDILRRLRKAAGLTQMQLAQKAGVGNGTIGNYESGGRSKIRLDVAVKIADALGVSIDVFSGDEYFRGIFENIRIVEGIPIQWLTATQGELEVSGDAHGKKLAHAIGEIIRMWQDDQEASDE